MMKNIWEEALIYHQINKSKFKLFKRIQNYDYFSAKIPKNIIEGLIFYLTIGLLKLERDERFTYFIKFGTLRRYEGDGDIIFVEVIKYFYKVRFLKYLRRLLFIVVQVIGRKHMIDYT